ncbi:hypothetical protein ACRALDRAFT_2044264 [Sodiomyces alcalophilus JCM 7366]|uniref:uncharacterized protein n=1 Tax=Sodiomyces alcalophilus JCM 7366 TaxID=591952 RepID=UPI0039B6C6DE
MDDGQPNSARRSPPQCPLTSISSLLADDPLTSLLHPHSRDSIDRCGGSRVRQPFVSSLSVGSSSVRLVSTLGK